MFSVDATLIGRAEEVGVLLAPRHRVCRPFGRRVRRTLGNPAGQSAKEWNVDHPIVKSVRAQIGIVGWDSQRGDRVRAIRLKAPQFAVDLGQSHLRGPRGQVTEFLSLDSATDSLLRGSDLSLEVCRGSDYAADYSGNHPPAACDRRHCCRAADHVDQRKDTIDSPIKALVHVVERHAVEDIKDRLGVVPFNGRYGLLGSHSASFEVEAAASDCAAGVPDFSFPWSVPCEQVGGVGANILSQVDSTAHIESEDVAEVHIPGVTTTPPAPGAVRIGPEDV
ncbi:hypothetical protein AGI3411_03686 [Achromobacter agilis]|uniref:Uncharacterized protein n=1 Tax=Achromobacter agilis TaxID=1353888 RepID=A0A446CKP5_9BURK|nr:hypothetical protein AGI3411_03686 [Achromobacter agilis]